MSRPIIKRDDYWADVWNSLFLRPVYRKPFPAAADPTTANSPRQKVSEPSSSSSPSSMARAILPSEPELSPTSQSVGRHDQASEAQLRDRDRSHQGRIGRGANNLVSIPLQEQEELANKPSFDLESADLSSLLAELRLRLSDGHVEMRKILEDAVRGLSAGGTDLGPSQARTVPAEESPGTARQQSSGTSDYTPTSEAETVGESPALEQQNQGEISSELEAGLQGSATSGLPVEALGSQILEEMYPASYFDVSRLTGMGFEELDAKVAVDVMNRLGGHNLSQKYGITLDEVDQLIERIFRQQGIDNTQHLLAALQSQAAQQAETRARLARESAMTKLQKLKNLEAAPTKDFETRYQTIKQQRLNADASSSSKVHNSSSIRKVTPRRKPKAQASPEWSSVTEERRSQAAKHIRETAAEELNRSNGSSPGLRAVLLYIRVLGTMWTMEELQRNLGLPTDDLEEFLEDRRGFWIDDDLALLLIMRVREWITRVTEEEATGIRLSVAATVDSWKGIESTDEPAFLAELARAVDVSGEQGPRDLRPEFFRTPSDTHAAEDEDLMTSLNKHLRRAARQNLHSKTSPKSEQPPQDPAT